MILHRLEFTGISTAFPDPVVIDFDELGGGLIAFVGENGEGKSHAMELSGPGTTHRKFPSYGDDSFHLHAHPAAAISTSELTWSVGGHRYRLLVKYDAGAGKTRATLYRDDAPKPIAGPERLGDVDAVLEKILPSYKVILASSFASQSREGAFADLSKAKRKELFMELLGLVRLEELAAVAKARRLGEEHSLELLRPQIDTARTKAERSEQLTGEIDGHSTRIDALTEKLETVRADQTTGAEQLEAARAEQQKLEAKAETYASQREQFVAAVTVAHDAETFAANALGENQRSLSNAVEVESAYKRCQEIDAGIAEAQKLIDDATTKRSPVESERATLAERRSTLLTEHGRIKGELDRAEAAEKRLAGADDLEGAVQQRKTEREEAKTTLADAEAKTEQLETDANTERTAITRRAAIAVRKTDFEKRAKLVSAVDVEHSMCSECPAITDAREAALALPDINHELEELQIDGTPAQDALRNHRTEVTRLRGVDQTTAENLSAAQKALAESKADIEKAGEAPRLREELKTNVAEGTNLRGRIDALESEIAQAQTTIDHHIRIRTELAEERVPLVPLAESMATVTAARTQKEQVESAHASAVTRREGAEADLTELGAEPDLTAAKQAVESAQAVVTAKNAEIDSVNAELTPLSESVQRLTGERGALGEDPAGALKLLESQEKELETAAADFAQIEKAFGKDGIQALEIDAAGPTVTAIANDLLSSCYGSRFQLRIDTTEPMSKGEGVKEVFDVKILDAESPDGERKSGSGGEQAILDEALRLAIAIFNTQRSGHEMLTLWRDETGGALSENNASRYMRMLRRAREIGGFHSIIFISHNPSIWAQADARVFFAGGKASETQPDQVAA